VVVNGSETVGQPWRWEAGWLTISFQPSLAGGSGCIDTCGGTRIPGKFEAAGKGVFLVEGAVSHGQPN
jgi:hypothetical protein